MNKDDLKKHELKPIRFHTATTSGSGILNYSTGDDQFFIVHTEQPHSNVGTSGRIDLDDAMLENITQENGVLVYRAQS